MKKLLCLVLPLFALCTGFKVPFSNQQTDNKPKKIWCGGYLTVNNSILSTYPEITAVKVSDASSVRYYNVPSSPSSYDVPETFHTGESYTLTFTVYLGAGIPGFPTENEWTFEIKEPDGTVVKRALFEIYGAGSENIIFYSFTPECISYEVSVRRRNFFDIPIS